MEHSTRGKPFPLRPQNSQALWKHSHQVVDISQELREEFALLLEEAALILEEATLLTRESQHLLEKGSRSLLSVGDDGI